MQNQSKLLKVVSIIMIVFGALSLVTSVGMLSVSDSMADTYASLGVAAPTTGSMIFSIVAALVELVAGIVGVMRKSSQLILIFGVLMLLITVINIITAITGGLFTFAVVLGLIIPVLYLWGWYQAK